MARLRRHPELVDRPAGRRTSDPCLLRGRPGADAGLHIPLIPVSKEETVMSELTPERVVAAYDALMSGDPVRAAEYWDPQVRFLTPGNHQYSGWHEGLDAFMNFIG